jgi:hypothetical protein
MKSQSGGGLTSDLSRGGDSPSAHVTDYNKRRKCAGWTSRSYTNDSVAVPAIGQRRKMWGRGLVASALSQLQHTKRQLTKRATSAPTGETQRSSERVMKTYKEAANVKTAKQKAEQARFEAEVAQRVLDERPEWTWDPHIRGLVQRKREAADAAEKAANDVQRTEAENALEVLLSRGRDGFKEPEKASIGAALGFALYSLLDWQHIADAAETGLEQWNAHLLVAVMQTIRAGENGDPETRGKYERDGRTVTITLPKWWAEIR